MDPFYYRIEIPIPAGEFPEPAEARLLQEIERLRLSRAEAADLEAARREALDFLESRAAVHWFASHGISERREQGMVSIEAFSADDMRAAARDLLMFNRVVASWPPAARQLTIEVEALDKQPAPSVSERRPTAAIEKAVIIPAPYPPHAHPPLPAGAPERLPSGVSLVQSTMDGVFVAGAGLTIIEQAPGEQVMTRFQEYRPDRILVLATAASRDRAQQLWSAFKGNPSDARALYPPGEVTAGDLPALFLLKVLLDRSLIEYGLWHAVKLQINASTGAVPEMQHPAVREWISRIASEGPSEAELAWARETLRHHYDRILPDLQALTWERVPQWIIQDPDTISPRQVQDAARNYF
jgi:hypothetical protein